MMSNPLKYSEFPSIDEIIDKLINAKYCCEYCADPNNDYEPFEDCNTCDTIKKYNIDLINLKLKLQSLPHREIISDMEYMLEELCPKCIFDTYMECGGNSYYPPDRVSMCNLFNDINEDYNESCSRCKGRFFIHNSKSNIPVPYEEYYGDDVNG